MPEDVSYAWPQLIKRSRVWMSVTPLVHEGVGFFYFELSLSGRKPDAV